MQRFTITSLATVVGFALVLSGCDSGPTGGNPPANSAVSTAQVSEMSAAAAEGADESLGSLLESVGSGFAMFVSPNPCPTVTVVATTTPPSIVTTVQFGDLPENVTFPPAADDPCLRTGEHGNGKVYLFGHLVATMAGTRESEFSRSEQLDNVGFVGTETDFTTFWRGQRDGSRSFSRDATGKLMLAENLTTTRKRKTETDEFGNTITSQLEWSFTPVTGEVLQEHHERPSGTIVVTGSWHFVGKVRVEEGEGDAATHTLVDVDVTRSVKTNQPLEYDATCVADSPRRRIKAGQLEFARQSGSDPAQSFTLTWTACGVAPTKAAVPTT